MDFFISRNDFPGLMGWIFSTYKTDNKKGVVGYFTWQSLGERFILGANKEEMCIRDSGNDGPYAFPDDTLI